MIVAEVAARLATHIGEHLVHRTQPHTVRIAVIHGNIIRHAIDTSRTGCRRSVQRAALNCDFIRVSISHRAARCRLVRCALDGFSIIAVVTRAACAAIHDVMRRQSNRSRNGGRNRRGRIAARFVAWDRRGRIAGWDSRGRIAARVPGWDWCCRIAAWIAGRDSRGRISNAGTELLVKIIVPSTGARGISRGFRVLIA